jgi:hypothetical protein
MKFPGGMVSGRRRRSIAQLGQGACNAPGPPLQGIVTLLHYVMVQGNSPQTIEVSDMQDTISGRFGKALGIGCAVMMAMMALAGTPAAAASDKSHSHEAHKSDDIYRGYFEDSQIEARTLADWEGDWQSVYPYLIDRSLDPVLAHKAENGEKDRRGIPRLLSDRLQDRCRAHRHRWRHVHLLPRGKCDKRALCVRRTRGPDLQEGQSRGPLHLQENRRRCRSTDVRSVQRPCHRSGEGQGTITSTRATTAPPF